MWKSLLSSVWRRTPRRLRRLGVRLTQSRFTVTGGAVVTDARGRVLLLKHVFRSGSGWGVPGGFLEPGEQPEEGIRRELREEAGLEVKEVWIVAARAFRRPQQVEILFRALCGCARRPRRERRGEARRVVRARRAAARATRRSASTDQACPRKSRAAGRVVVSCPRTKKKDVGCQMSDVSQRLSPLTSDI